ncbi:MAG: radical SAM protein [Candidatus Omnitrophica bacterium]|nr:radical SAM protein [Candidatus Omnitrophota bacterium]
MKADIAEIFLSYQGEGPYAGSRQIFVRFSDCNLGCAYCDTRERARIPYTAGQLIDEISAAGDFNEMSLTGGEPLLYSGFLREALPLFKGIFKNKIYLETNGTLPGRLKEVIDTVDIVSMDLKLPSSTGQEKGYWREHAEFVDICSGKELILKAVVTADTLAADIEKAADIIRLSEKDTRIVLQPVTPVEYGADIKRPEKASLQHFSGIIERRTGRAPCIMGQIHRMLGVR